MITWTSTWTLSGIGRKDSKFLSTCSLSLSLSLSLCVCVCAIFFFLFFSSFLSLHLSLSFSYNFSSYLSPHLSLSSHLSLSLSLSLRTLFCRMCFVYDCPFHGISPKSHGGVRRQPENLPIDLSPCSPSCGLVEDNISSCKREREREREREGEREIS